MEKYVKDIVGSFAKDERILGWDMWNEPDDASPLEPPSKIALVRVLLPKVFAWAQSQDPVQPLTSGFSKQNYEGRPLDPTEQIQMDNSDILSFHR